jgi:hypothetical protein
MTWHSAELQATTAVPEWDGQLVLFQVICIIKITFFLFISPNFAYTSRFPGGKKKTSTWMWQASDTGFSSDNLICTWCGRLLSLEVAQ